MKQLSQAVGFRLWAWRHRDEMLGLHAPLRRFMRLIPRGGLALDVGADTGRYTYWLARRARQVHAFEPRPEAADAIRRRLMSNVTVHNVALSDEPGEAELFVPQERGTRASIEPGAREGAGHVVTVPRVRLDDLALEQVRFVKIDVEGHELSVIRGGARTIGRDLPTVFCESEERHREGSVRDLVAAMRDDFGYHAYFWLRGNLIPIERFNLRKHQLEKVEDVKSPDYVNNFVFLPGPSQRAE